MKKIINYLFLISLLLIGNTSIAQISDTLTYTGTIQNWTAPSGYNLFRIEVRGAEGGFPSNSNITGGLGAIMIGDFALTPGDVLQVVVGQQPTNNSGGGGSFVVDATNNPLIIAGGGGGGSQTTDSNDKHGNITTTGGTGSAGGGVGGANGNGGTNGTSSFQSGAGGGFLTNGADGWAVNTGGTSFFNVTSGAGGAFGGGGTGSGYVVGGGGGGYSGGGSGGNTTGGVGGGGASFNSGINQQNTGGINSGNGMVIITSIDTLIISEFSPISCNGSNDGVLVAIATIGTPPFSYAWSNGSTSDTISNVTPGTYSVTLTDASSNTTVTSYTVTEPQPLTVNSVVTSNNSCFNESNGELSSTVSGGTSPYFYSWSNGDTTSYSSNLSQGIYSLTVTDNNGCTFSVTDTVTSPDSLYAEMQIDSVTCFGDEDGAVYATNYGGTAPYSTFWTNGSFDSFIEDLNGGVYYYILTDANNCSFIDTVEVFEPNEIQLTVAQSQDASCQGYNDGSALLAVQGGNGSNSFVWDNGLSSDNETNLTEGTYNVTVTDFKGCEASTVVNIGFTNPSPNVNLGNDFAVGIPSLVTLQSNASGDHLWSDGSTNSSLQVEVLSDTSIWVSVTNQFGCTGTDTIRIEGLVGIDGVENEYLVKMFPNPTSGELNIQIENNVANNIAIQVMDYSGKVVVNKEFNNTGSQFTDRINLNKFSKGIYFINIKLDDQIHTERIVVQ